MMVAFLVYIVVLVIVCVFLYWLLEQIPLPPPLQKIATIVLVAIGVIILIALLLQFAGSGTIHLPGLPK
jgi:hypothetical protein